MKAEINQPDYELLLALAAIGNRPVDALAAEIMSDGIRHRLEQAAQTI